MSALAGQRVLVTRPREQAAELTAGLEALGAEVVHLPLIAIAPPEDWAPLDRALSHLSDFDWVALTSANAVEAVFARMQALGLAVPDVKWAVVGRRTAEVLRAKGAAPEVTAEPATAECLAERMVARGVAGRRVLFPRSDRAREVLPQLLREAQAEVEMPVAYRTVSAEATDLQALLPGLSWVTLTSPSTWHELLKALGEEPLPAHVGLAAIGPTTAAAVRESGYEVACVAEPPGVKGLLEAMVRTESEEEGGPPLPPL